MKRAILEVTLAILTLVVMVAGGLNYFATAEEVKQVETRLEQKITSDAIMQLSQRIWSLEDRHKKEGSDERFWSSQDDMMEYRELKEQREELKLKLLDIIKK